MVFLRGGAVSDEQGAPIGPDVGSRTFILYISSVLTCTIWGMKFKLPWREAGLPNHHDDNVDSD